MRKQKVVKSDKVMNLHNPRMYGKTEFAFEARGTKYYNFKADSEARYGRYIILQAFLQEYNLRMDLDYLKGNIKQMQSWLNPGLNSDGSVTPIRIDKCNELLSIMEQRANIAFEPDTVYRLASCLFFDETEVLTVYDKKHNDEKIARWKEANVTDFFFNKLFIESTRLKVTSKTDLENFLRQAPELLKGWSTVKDTLLL